jgi:hypothetical protein
MKSIEITPSMSTEEIMAVKQELENQLVTTEIPRQVEVINRQLAYVAFELGERESDTPVGVEIHREQMAP